MAGKRWAIGHVSKETGVNIETIRYYERKGLTPSPPRSSGGHRTYDETTIRRLRFVRRSRELGFTLNDIRTLLSMVDGGNECAEIHSLTLQHLETIRGRIRDLRRLDKTLSAIAAECEKQVTPDCPIIDALYEGR